MVAMNLIDIISVANADIENVRKGSLLIDCNDLPELPTLSGLRSYMGNSEEVQLHYRRSVPHTKALIANAVDSILEQRKRFVAFYSNDGTYRSPAVACLVADELCQLGHRVYVTHLKVNVPSEELTPVRDKWGYDAGW